jgi:hypothetical protein
LVRYSELLRLIIFRLTEICNQDRRERTNIKWWYYTFNMI